MVMLSLSSLFLTSLPVCGIATSGIALEKRHGLRFTSVKWIPCVPHLHRFPAFSPSHQGSMKRRKETTRSREMSFKSNGTSFPPERCWGRTPLLRAVRWMRLDLY